MPSPCDRVNHLNPYLGTNNGVGPIFDGDVASYNLLVTNGTTSVPFWDFYYETNHPPLNPTDCESPNGYTYDVPWGFSIKRAGVQQYTTGFTVTATVNSLVAWLNTNIGPGFTNTMSWQQLEQHSHTFPGWALPPSPPILHNINLNHATCKCDTIIVPDSWNCSGSNGVATPSGSIAPYTCFDPGTGNGQYQGLTAYSDCLTNCKEYFGLDPGLTGDPITYNCILQLGGTIGVCTDPGDGSGQYTGPTAHNDCLTNCGDASVDPDLPIIEGWNCDSSTGQCSGPVIGGSYPTLATCQATCGVISVGNCAPIDSCPCGWDHVFNVSRNSIDCTNRLTTMPSIKKCMSFQHPTSGAIIQPVIGDTWIDNGSYAGISWTKAVVVNTANPTVVGTGSIEVKTTPCRGL